jgi:hypothetical protein
MERTLRIASSVLSAAALLAAAAVVVLYVTAIGSLSADGPTASGYDLLAVANRTVPWVAVAVAGGVVTRSLLGRVIVPAGTLALASGLVGGAALAAHGIALFLSHVGQHAQPPALNSFILAIAGSAQDVAPAAIVLAAGAVVLAAGRAVAVLRTRRAPVVLPA